MNTEETRIREKERAPLARIRVASVFIRASLLCCWLLISAAPAAAESPGIVEFSVWPPKVELRGPGARQSLLVTGKTATGEVRDVTREAEFEIEDATVATRRVAVIMPQKSGATTLLVRVPGAQGPLQQRVPVSIAEFETPRRYDFELDVLPVLSRFSCNTSSCHGKAEGQNGFKLSVFAFDPRADYEALAMEGRGRRTFPAAPDRSLILAKPSGAAPHAGGLRIPADSDAYATLRGWIIAGLPYSTAGDVQLTGITVTPRERRLAMGDQQQMRVTARYSDGRTADVTHLARFQTNDEGIASVDGEGLVTAGTIAGQAAVMASFMGSIDVFQVLVPRREAPASFPEVPANNFIDPLVVNRLKLLNIVPSDLCSDAEYLRRVYLDVIGTLPTPAEVRAFLADTQPDKRAKLVNTLVERPEFADYWAMQWADLLRVERQAQGRKGAYSYYRWIRDQLAAGRPLDEFAREVITAEGPLAEVPAGNFYKVDKKPGQWASAVSQVFLGIRITCAECHHHPYDRWGQADYYGMEAFFNPLQTRKSPRGDVLSVQGVARSKHPRTGEAIFAHPLGEPPPAPPMPPAAGAAASAADARVDLARWLTAGDNPWFARNLANRAWAHFLGRGLVEPVDDVRETNPPSNPALLDALAKRLVDSKFDLRDLVRTITASRTYQLSARPNETNVDDERNYSRALFRRLEAEVLLDAVCQVTDVPEKFEGLPGGIRAVQLWDNQSPHYFLKLFGRPTRVTPCECERGTEASVGQVLHLLNSPQLQGKLSHAAGRIARLARDEADNGKVVEELYLACFSRLPTESERARGLAHLTQATAAAPADAALRAKAAEDLTWSLLNTIEFLFNH